MFLGVGEKLKSIARGAGRAAEDADHKVQEVAETLALGLLAEDVESLERSDVMSKVVIERNTIKAEVGAQMPLFRRAIEVAALGMIETGRAEWVRGVLDIFRAPRNVYIRGV